MSKQFLADDSIIVIEMQVARMAAFSKRVMYNLAKGYANQLTKGEDYPRLNPVIAVTITDFKLFNKTEKVINKFVFWEETGKFAYPDQEMKMIFVELPKFKKTLEELETLADKWIYFLKEATSLESIPETLGKVSEIELALNLASQANMTVEEFDIVDRRGIMLQDEKGKLTYAEEEGLKRGLEQGLKQGLEQGRRQEAIALILRQLNKRFGKIPRSISTQIEALSIEKLAALGEDFLDFESVEDLQNWLSGE